MQKPAVSAMSDVPGTRSRFDDFSFTHIIQAPHVHFSVRILCLHYLGQLLGKLTES